MLHKALNFRPLGHDPDRYPRLHQLLAQCPVVFEVDANGDSIHETLPKFSGRNIDNLRDFLLLKKISLIGPPTPLPERPIGEEVTQADLDQELYWAPRLSVTTPRRLTDLWLVLRQVCNADPQQPCKIRADAVLEVLENHCDSLLEEEEAFLPDARRKILRAFRGRPGGRWDLDRLTRALTPENSVHYGWHSWSRMVCMTWPINCAATPYPLV
jgi:YD repeat-containing protein